MSKRKFKTGDWVKLISLPKYPGTTLMKLGVGAVGEICDYLGAGNYCVSFIRPDIPAHTAVLGARLALAEPPRPKGDDWI